MAESRLPILIVGATGNLGSLITRKCLNNPNFLVNTLVFESNKDNCLCEEVSKAGGKCIQADITKPETFRGVTKGIHTVISAVLGDRNVLWEGQCNLLKDSIENGVKRFVPSDFTIDVWNLPQGENCFIDQHLNFRKRLEQSNVKGLYFSNGVLMESYFWFARKYGFNYFGDINQKINLTAQEDVAEVVALAISNRERFGDVRYYGSSMSTRELTDLYNMISGEKLEPKCLGSLEDLKNRKAENCGKDMGMDLLCSFLLPLYDGRGLIKDTNINDIGQVKLMNVEEFLKRSQQKGFQYEFPITELSKKFQQICGSK